MQKKQDVSVLQTNGSGVLSFASGGGKVLQVVTATDIIQRTTTSTSFVTGSNTLSVSITPSSASNKVFIIASHYVYNSATACQYTIFRGATNIGSSTGNNSIGYFDSNNGAIDGSLCYTVLDSPSTTSATTYQVYMKAGSGTTYLGSTSYLSRITAFEIAA